MKTMKLLGLSLFTLFVLTLNVELGGSRSTSERIKLASVAEAVVGRPLTPISVAGVARRSVRRCAYGAVC